MYMRLAAFRCDPILVDTCVGRFRWKPNALTSQQHIRGTYEPHMQKAFANFVKPGMVVFDIGAFAGFHSLNGALLTGSSGRVFAFEPNPITRRCLIDQIEANPELRVTALPYAVSDHSGPVRFDASGGSQSHVTDHGGLTVQAATLDSLIATGSLPIPHVIKIDVEGHEREVLRGSVNILRNHRPVVLCDYNDSETLSVVRRSLASFGYDVSGGPPVIAAPLPEASIKAQLEKN